MLSDYFRAIYYSNKECFGTAIEMVFKPSQVASSLESPFTYGYNYQYSSFEEKGTEDDNEENHAVNGFENNSWEAFELQKEEQLLQQQSEEEFRESEWSHSMVCGEEQEFRLPPVSEEGDKFIVNR